jgi:WhiB family redox-sensing transcriptional regulator
VALRDNPVETLTWQRSAACRGPLSLLFFPPAEFEPKDDRQARESRAKAICAECQVRSECLQFALRTCEPHGVWGGLNELERKALGARRTG